MLNTCSLLHTKSVVGQYIYICDYLNTFNLWSLCIPNFMIFLFPSSSEFLNRILCHINTIKNVSSPSIVLQTSKLCLAGITPKFKVFQDETQILPLTLLNTVEAFHGWRKEMFMYTDIHWPGHINWKISEKAGCNETLPIRPESGGIEWCLPIVQSFASVVKQLDSSVCLKQ